MNWSKTELECAEQLWTVTWDGDLISKSARDNLVDCGFAQRGGNGFNWLTADGVRFVAELKTRQGDGDPPHWRRHFERFGSVAMRDAE